MTLDIKREIIFTAKKLVDIGFNLVFVLLIFKYLILLSLVLMMIRYMVSYSTFYLMRFWKNSDMLIIICLFISFLYVLIFSNQIGLISSIWLELLLVFVFFRSSFLTLKLKY